MPTDNCIWGTADEINFLREAIPKDMSKLQFLLNYKEAICTRKDWGSIDPKRLVKLLEKEIIATQKGE